MTRGNDDPSLDREKRRSTGRVAGSSLPDVLLLVRSSERAYGHPRLVVRRCLCLTRAKAPEVDGPLLTGRRLKTGAEGATSVADGDDTAAIA